MKKGTIIPITVAVLIGLMIFMMNERTLPSENVQKQEVTKEDALLWAKARNFYYGLPTEVDILSDEVELAKSELGQLLYFDTRLSINNEQSCNSCHNLQSYGVDNLPTSPGALPGTRGDRNSPTVLNAVFHAKQFWDGRAADLEEQAKGPILNPVEMAIPHEGILIDRLLEVEEYIKRFSEAFPEQTQPITYDNVAKAIASFEKRLITPSKFDEFMALNVEVFDSKEKRGLKIFLEAGCQSCHDGPALGGLQERRLGEQVDFKQVTSKINQDKGIYELTGNPGDQYKFKVPSLRNIEHTYPYFHDGSIHELDESVRIMGKTQLNKEFTAQEVEDLIAFLKTLTGEIPAHLKAIPDIPK